MKILLFFFSFIFLLLADFSEVCGNYYGEKEDYATEIKLYDDSTFKYSARREFPFEVSEGTWSLHNDTVTLNSIPCPDPEALTHVPVRTYFMFKDARYVYRKNSITPIVKGKAMKGEILLKEKAE